MKLQISIFAFVLSTVFCCNLANGQAFWTFTTYGSPSNLTSGSSYYLKVVRKGKGNGNHLTYKKRRTGINLSWGKQAAPNIRIEKEGGGIIKCGDKVAIHVKNGGYIKYEKRNFGINIVWSTPPVYEWEIRSLDNKPGSALTTESRVGLYNTRNKEFMVFCNRVASNTVNLTWFSDCKKGIRLPGQLNDVTADDLVKIGMYVLPLIVGG